MARQAPGVIGTATARATAGASHSGSINFASLGHHLTSGDYPKIYEAILTSAIEGDLKVLTSRFENLHVWCMAEHPLSAETSWEVSGAPSRAILAEALSTISAVAGMAQRDVYSRGCNPGPQLAATKAGVSRFLNHKVGRDVYSLIHAYVPTDLISPRDMQENKELNARLQQQKAELARLLFLQQENCISSRPPQSWGPDGPWGPDGGYVGRPKPYLVADDICETCGKGFASHECQECGADVHNPVVGCSKRTEYWVPEEVLLVLCRACANSGQCSTVDRGNIW